MPQVADIQNSSNWEQLYSISKDAEYTSSAIFKPIDEIVVPTYVSSSLIVTYADSNNAPPNWYSAGYLQKDVSVGITVGNNQNTKFEYSRRVPLRKAALVQIPGFGENYKLSFRPHKWFDNITFSVWQYLGDIIDLTKEQVELTRIDVLRLEKKFDVILYQVLEQS